MLLMKMILSVRSYKYRGSVSWQRVGMEGFVKVENPGSNPSLTSDLYSKKQQKPKWADRNPYDWKWDFPRLCQMFPSYFLRCNFL